MTAASAFRTAGVEGGVRRIFAVERGQKKQTREKLKPYTTPSFKLTSWIESFLWKKLQGFTQWYETVLRWVTRRPFFVNEVHARWIRARYYFVLVLFHVHTCNPVLKKTFKRKREFATFRPDNIVGGPPPPPPPLLLSSFRLSSSPPPSFLLPPLPPPPSSSFAPLFSPSSPSSLLLLLQSSPSPPLLLLCNCKGGEGGLAQRKPKP